jgi:hypothetical protein
MSDTTTVPVGALLDTWTSLPWEGGLQVEHLRDLEGVEVRTRNTLYRMTIVSAQQGEVLVIGGRFFPTFTRARLNGCTMGGSLLKLRGVYPGFRLEFQIDRQVIVTSEVVGIAVIPAADLARSEPVH